jgi:hypothetical protein
MFYALSNAIKVMKSRRMGWPGHVVRMGGMRIAYNILIAKPEGKRLLGRPRSRWKIILEWILGTHVGKLWTGCI